MSPSTRPHAPILHLEGLAGGGRSGGIDLNDGEELSQEHLRVYPPRPEEIEGAGAPGEETAIWWTPGHGLVRTPPGWTFVPRGDAFVTRKVKAAGRYWEVVRARPKKGYTERLGLLAPAAHVAEAQRLAEQTQAARERRRAASARARSRAEERYREQLQQAILEYLAFHPAYADLAKEIAQGAAEHAAEVGSGRVGRSRHLPLAKRAELAARAHIRHHYTSYEDTLQFLRGPYDDLDGLTRLDDELYHIIKAEAHAEVDAFLERHRRPPEGTDQNGQALQQAGWSEQRGLTMGPDSQG